MSNSRLYPFQWGSGKDKFLDLTLTAYSFECVGREAEALGDKIILPQDALKDVSRMKLPFPLTFLIGKAKFAESRKKKIEARIKKKNTTPLPNGQYCGSLEFSAPKGSVYVPEWIMKNIGIKESEKVHIISVNDVPKGEWCKFQPHTKEMVDLMADLGPRFFLEEAMRHFSVLNKGERIQIEHAGKKHDITVKEVKPTNVISILGNVDLSVEFAPPKDGSYGTEEDNEEQKRPEPTSSPLENPSSHSKSSSSDSPSSPSASKRKPSSSSAGRGKSGKPKPEKKSTTKKSESSGSSTFGPTSGSSTSEPITTSTAAVNQQPSFVEDPSQVPSADESWTCPIPASWWREPSSFPFFSNTQYVSKQDPEASKKRTAIFPSFFSDKNAPEEAESASRKFFGGAGHSLKRTSPSNTAADDTKHTDAAGAAAGSGRVDGSNAEWKPVERPKPVVCANPSEADKKDPNKQECGNCGRYVESSRMQLHSLHCSRSLTQCPKCKLVFNKSDMPSHNEAHEEIKCQCGEAVEEMHMEEHKQTTCGFRRVPCMYCGDEQRFVNLAEHEEACGQMQEECPTCKERVKLCEKKDHNEICKPQCECGERVHIDSLAEHKETLCGWRKVLCEYCNLKVRHMDYVAHEKSCGSRTTQCDKCNKYIAKRDMAVHMVQCTGPEEKKKKNKNKKEEEDAIDLTDPAAVVERRVREMDEQLVERVKGISEVTAGFSLQEDDPDAFVEDDRPLPSTIQAQKARKSKHEQQQEEDDGGFACPKCLFACRDFEDLQMHMLTVCPKRVDSSNPRVKKYDAERRRAAKKAAQTDEDTTASKDGNKKKTLTRKASFVDKLRKETSLASKAQEEKEKASGSGKKHSAGVPRHPGRSAAKRNSATMGSNIAAGSPINAIRASRKQTPTGPPSARRRSAKRTTITVPQKKEH